MTRHRPYRQKSINPYLGISPANATALGYRSVSPNGDNGVIGARLSYRALAPVGAVDAPTIVHCSLYIVHCWTFTFSAKERDSETGLSYFGSRYYSSDLSIWLSVDPMAAKFPHQSNYVYCSNNPIKLFDPNGEDEWEVNEETGHIKHYSNDKPDRLFVTTYDGKRREDIDPLDVDRTVMEKRIFDGHRTIFASQDKREEMNQLFDYLADNTYVEWAHIGASLCFDTKEGEITSTQDMLFTSHDYTSTSMRGELKDFAIGGFLDFHKHSHPNKYLGDNLLYKLAYPTSSYLPSPADLELKNSFPMPEIPYKQPYFLLRNVKTNIYY